MKTKKLGCEKKKSEKITSHVFFFFFLISQFYWNFFSLCHWFSNQLLKSLIYPLYFLSISLIDYNYHVLVMQNLRTKQIWYKGSFEEKKLKISFFFFKYFPIRPQPSWFLLGSSTWAFLPDILFQRLCFRMNRIWIHCKMSIISQTSQYTSENWWKMVGFFGMRTRFSLIKPWFSKEQLINGNFCSSINLMWLYFTFNNISLK